MERAAAWPAAAPAQSFWRKAIMDTAAPTGATIERDHDHGTQESASWSASATARAQESASKAADTMKDRARDIAEQQKAAGADQLGGVADAMKAAAGDLRDKIPLASEYIDEVAGRLGRVASDLRERSVDDMVGNVADFARKQPAFFFAGAVAAGFALSRFAKSSGKREDGSNV
jgi:hypothetical protein